MENTCFLGPEGGDNVICFLTSRKKAFSLIELLVVVAVVGILGTYSVTGFKNIAISHGVGQGASEARGLLEFARSEAVTRQTYVWAAFREATNGGVLEVQMAVGGSADGSADAEGGNVKALSPVKRVRNVGLVKFSSLNAKTQALLGGGVVPAELLDNKEGIHYSGAGHAEFTGTTITFTPRGEAMLEGSPGSASGFDPWIGLGMVPARGSQKDPSGRDDAGIVVDGSTGISRQLRVN